MRRMGWKIQLLVVAFALAGGFLLLPAHAQAGVAGRAPVWQKTWKPTGGRSLSLPLHLARSSTGDIYTASVEQLGSGGGYGWVVLRFTADGTRRWVRRVTGALQFYSLAGAAADGDGNVALAGQVLGSGSALQDWLVVAYDRRGRLLWQRRFTGDQPGEDRVTGIVAGPGGSWYVAGYVFRAGKGEDAALVRYSRSGRRLWVRYVDGPAHGYDRFSAVAVDGRGRAYVAGHDYDAPRANDIVVARYRPTGRRDWLTRWGDGVALRNDTATDIAVRGSSVAVAGVTTAGDAGWTERGTALALTAGGSLRWSRVRANDSPSLPARFDLVGVDGGGRVSAAGTMTTWAGQPPPLRWITTTYGVSGNEGPLQQLWGDVEPFNYPAALAVTDAGRVYETGSVNFSSSGRDALIVSRRPSGDLGWSSRVFAVGASPDWGDGIVATSGSVYVAGRTGQSLVLLKYRP